MYNDRNIMRIRRNYSEKHWWEHLLASVENIYNIVNMGF